MRPTGQVPNTTPTYLTHCLYRKYLNLVNSTWSRYFGANFFFLSHCACAKYPSQSERASSALTVSVSPRDDCAVTQQEPGLLAPSPPRSCSSTFIFSPPTEHAEPSIHRQDVSLGRG